jgi:hypothetical protein
VSLRRGIDATAGRNHDGVIRARAVEKRLGSCFFDGQTMGAW